jgi:hypothetical protein
VPKTWGVSLFEMGGDEMIGIPFNPCDITIYVTKLKKIVAGISRFLRMLLVNTAPAVGGGAFTVSKSTQNDRLMVIRTAASCGQRN